MISGKRQTIQLYILCVGTIDNQDGTITKSNIDDISLHLGNKGKEHESRNLNTTNWSMFWKYMDQRV